MKEYYILTYITEYSNDIFSTIIDKNPFDYLLDTALEGECLTYINSIRIKKKDYKKYIKNELELPFV